MAALVSVVIPALNERVALPGTLARLLTQRGRFEAIVVDGGSHDGTPGVARAFPGVQVIKAARGRARQMNAGAAAARGDWLVFLHADTELPPGALERIAGLSCDAGAFRHSFADPDWRLRLLSWASSERSRLTRIFYGDQAIFVRTALFRAMGGFPEVDALEDVLFCEALARRTRAVLLDAPVRTDARKFRKFGVVRATSLCLHILARHALRRPVSRHRFFEDVR